MVLCVFGDFFLNNCSLFAGRIDSLVSFFKNFISLLLSYLLSRQSFLRFNMPHFFILIYFLNIKSFIIPALTNSLFCIHPLLLYFSLCMCAQKISNGKKKNTFIWFFLNCCAQIMGGYWSMQELSWGGWWNWDVLEMGAFFVWIIFVIYIHYCKNKTKSCFIFAKSSLSTLPFFYAVLNKSGIGISIHSFVTTKSLQINYNQAILIIFVLLLLFKFKKLTFIPIIVLFVMYVWSKTLIIFKPLSLVFLILNKKQIKHIKTYIYHKLWYVFCLFFFVFNFSNFSLYKANIYNINILWLKNFKHFFGFKLIKAKLFQFIWKDMWLSKPLIRWGFYYELSSQRSLCGKTNYMGYKK